MRIFLKDNLSDLSKDLKAITEVFDLISDHIIITDTEGTIIYANKGAEEQTGYSAEEIIGKNPGKLWGGNMPKSFYEEMWKKIKTEKKTFVAEIKNKKKNGEEYWQELRIYPVLNEKGEIVIYIGIEPNITARKMAEGKLKEKYEEIDKLNQLMIEREIRMIELKKELNELRSKLASSTA